MAPVLQIAILCAAVYLVYRLAVSGARTGSLRDRNIKCATCRHCGKLFDDGVLCRFGDRETFKNEVHVGNCIDYRRRA